MRLPFSRKSFVMRSPLKRKLLRYPGESIDQEIDRTRWGMRKKLFWLVFAYGCFIGALIVELTNNFIPQLVVFSMLMALALFAFLYVVVFFRVADKKMENLQRGKGGEREVAEHLNGLQVKGARILHDIPGDGFNIDHVVICRGGVYAIETKTLSKPDKVDAKLYFDGTKISLFNKPLKRDPIAQVKASAEWLQDLIESAVDRKIRIQPAVVFPGWYIENKGNGYVWVLNPKALPTFIANDMEKSVPPLTNEGVEKIFWVLATHMQARSQEKAP